jgi:diaminopimelate decarboxylase
VRWLRPGRNYNGALRPPVIFCAGGAARVGVHRETYNDLLAREVEVY